jgi:hypothetical protein
MIWMGFLTTEQMGSEKVDLHRWFSITETAVPLHRACPRQDIALRKHTNPLTGQNSSIVSKDNVPFWKAKPSQLNGTKDWQKLWHNHCVAEGCCFSLRTPFSQQGRLLCVVLFWCWKATVHGVIERDLIKADANLRIGIRGQFPSLRVLRELRYSTNVKSCLLA